MEIRGITVCVDYADRLAITLPRNMRHLTECLVVTSPGDEDTRRVAGSVPGVRLHRTDAFGRHGAFFNKGLAMEEGFEILGRHGWLLIWDADILFPDHIPAERVRPDCLHGATRRILDDPARWTPDLDWRRLPVMRDGGPIGFFQLAHADAPDIRDKRPWYGVNFPHAGGGDAEFLAHFAHNRRVMLGMEVLHLGRVDRNWFGTTPEAQDMMAAYVHRQGWRRAMVLNDPTAVQRVPETPARVEVPGYPMSSFVMPFERAAMRQREARAASR